MAVWENGEETATVYIEKDRGRIVIRLADAEKNWIITGSNDRVVIDTNGVKAFTLRNAQIDALKITADSYIETEMELAGNNTCTSIVSDADTFIISEQANGSSLTVESIEDIGIDASGDVTFEGGIITVDAKETAIHARKVVVNGARLDVTVSSGVNVEAVIFAESSVELLTGSVAFSKPENVRMCDIGVADEGKIVLDTRIEIDNKTEFSKVPVGRQENTGDNSDSGADSGNNPGSDTDSGNGAGGDSGSDNGANAGTDSGNSAGGSLGNGTGNIAVNDGVVYDVGDAIEDLSSGVRYKIVGAESVSFYSVMNKKIKSMVIPDTITLGTKIYRVTAISQNAFKGCKKITRVTIGKNVAKIGKNAFKSCKKLKTVTIKTTKFTRKSIGANAFKGIYKTAVFQCPKKQWRNYRKWIGKAGAPKKSKYNK